jgi:hypothetical protein
MAISTERLFLLAKIAKNYDGMRPFFAGFTKIQRDEIECTLAMLAYGFLEADKATQERMLLRGLAVSRLGERQN